MKTQGPTTSRRRGVMKVQDVMSKNVRSCTPQDDLAAAARLLWNGDCGVLPIVVGAGRRVVGMLTDRDVCMAAWTQGRPLSEIPVEIAMASDVVTCRPEDDVSEVLGRLRARHVRRLPVVDESQQLLGIVSLVDFARAAAERGARSTVEDVCATLASISAPPPDSR
jgi:CBS domain-containing protein